MGDDELVHEVCRKERLTLYNFLMTHLSDYNRSEKSLLEKNQGNLFTTLNEERIKDLIHKEYEHYFRRKDKISIYTNKILRTEGFMNDLKNKIEVKH